MCRRMSVALITWSSVPYVHLQSLQAQEAVYMKAAADGKSSALLARQVPSCGGCDDIIRLCLAYVVLPASTSCTVECV